MSEPFLAEIRMMGFNFAPRGWATCDGQILPINQNQSLYSLLGTTYGGDGRTSFALPDLRSRTPIHPGTPSSGGGTNFDLGEREGQETHTLTVSEIPNHTHAIRGSSAGANRDAVNGNVYATTATNPYVEEGEGTKTPLAAASVGTTGGSNAHTNLQPFTVLSFCIAMQGLFPSRS